MKEARKLLKLFEWVDPDVVIVEHPSLSSIVSISSHKAVSLIKGRYVTKYVAKLDFNPDDMYKVKNITDIVYRAILIIASFIFNAIIVESPCAYKKLLKIIPYPISQILIKKLHVIPNGCLPPIREESSDNTRKKVILSIGNLVYQKGFDTLIKAFKRVNELHKDWELHIVGPIVDKKYYEMLRRMVLKMGLNNYVKFLGHISEDELEDEYSSASIFSLLSRYESFGIARCEAIVHGLPLVISEAGCGVQYKRCGSMVVPIGDFNAASIAIIKLIENSSLIKEVSKKQVDCVMTWDKVAEELHRLIQNI